MKTFKSFKSNKQRRAEIMAQRAAKRELAIRLRRAHVGGLPHATNHLRVAYEKLAPNNSYGYELHEFVARGYYLPVPFSCKDCGVAGVWSEASQKFWYEEVGGDVFTTAIRCRPCRAKERARRAWHRERSIAGWLTKQNQQQNLKQNEYNH